MFKDSTNRKSKYRSETIKKNQRGVLDLRNTITKVISLLYGLKHFREKFLKRDQQTLSSK